MVNLARLTAGVRRNYFYIIFFAMVLCFAGVLFVSRQKQTVGGARPYCLKGYACKMMSKNLSR